MAEETQEHMEGMITDEEGRLVPDYDQTIKIFDDGDIVSGEVVRVDRDEVLVDIGYKSEGAIPIRELCIRPDVNPLDVVSVGDHIDALVLQKEDKDGRLILSKKRAEYEKSWERIEKIATEGTTLEGQVIEVVKGGLIVDIGLRGFLPASLVGLRRIKELEQFIGERFECKIIEMDRNRNNVVLSRRAVLEEERRHERQKVLSDLKKGQTLCGKVSSVVDFGAFVDIGGIDGLVHISELCWGHVDHPSEVVQVGQEVKVQVLDVDLDRERISLGLRQTQDDPWREVAGRFEVGQMVEGTVTKLVPFGVFVEIAAGVEGLVHISELANRHVEVPEQVVRAGETVQAKIIGVDLDRRRISLSLRQLEEPVAEEEQEAVSEQEAEEAAAVEAEPEAKAEAVEETEVGVSPEAAETEAAPTAEAAEAAEQEAAPTAEVEVAEAGVEPEPEETAPEVQPEAAEPEVEPEAAEIGVPPVVAEPEVGMAEEQLEEMAEEVAVAPSVEPVEVEPVEVVEVVEVPEALQEPEPALETEAKVEAEAEVEAKVEAEAEAQAETEAAAEAQAEPEAEAEAQAETEAQAEAEVEVEAEAARELLEAASVVEEEEEGPPPEPGSLEEAIKEMKASRARKA